MYILYIYIYILMGFWSVNIQRYYTVQQLIAQLYYILYLCILYKIRLNDYLY